MKYGMEHMAEYVACLNEDPTLLEALRKEPRETVNVARLSREEKLLLYLGKADEVQAIMGEKKLPIKVREVLDELAAQHAKSD